MLYCGAGVFANPKILRGSPDALSYWNDPRYSSKLPPVLGYLMSIVLIAKPARTTVFGLTFHATPIRGWKLLLSVAPSG